MKFELFFDCDNAAFDPESGGELGEESARILEKLVADIRDGAIESSNYKFKDLRDTNGNVVGQWRCA